MASAQFVHLHNRSEYSLLNSALRVRRLVERAADEGMPAVALTDRMNMHAAISFYGQCYRAGIKPLLGAELRVEPYSPVVQVDPASPATYELVVLAEDNHGYEALCELLTRAHVDCADPTPYVRREWLEELAGHWIVLSGGAEGELCQALSEGRADDARLVARSLAAMAGEQRFYIELQWHGLDSERVVLPALRELAAELELPIVATNCCCYERREEARAVELLKRIATGTPVSSLEELEPASDQFHFRTADEMDAAFTRVPEAVQATLDIAGRCAVELRLDSGHLTPRFEPPDGSSGRAYLQALCDQGLAHRYPDWDDPDARTSDKLTKKKRREVEKRLAFELETIAHMGFVSYFLIVADFVRYAKDQGIPVGPGRGSATGSLVSYLLGITEVDPLDYGLLFERFLNPARKKMPDVDMDFCERRRDEVIAYVRAKYGNDRVCQIATFSTLRYKAALRDTGRILKLSDRTVDQLAAQVADYARNASQRYNLIRQAVERYDALHESYLHDHSIKAALDLAACIEGLPRNLSTHAAGVIIAPEPLRTLVPLTRGSGDEVVSQYDMYAVERLGLLKMDFLGLTTLTIIDDALKLIEGRNGTTPATDDIPFDDEATFTLLQQGDVLGVFQLEASRGIRQLAMDMRVSSLDDLIAVLALYRPGAMHNSKAYVDRKLGREPVTYLHPKLEPILKPTYGVMIYQEQVMECLHTLLGYTLAEADTFRQIMSKKDSRRMQSERATFLERADKEAIEPKLAEQLFDEIAKFAGYGFNKSHATAYAFVAYWTAWLKANYPAEFFAALLNSKMGATDKFVECQQNCRARNVAILPPDVNRSAARFTVDADVDGAPAIRFALGAIRNVGPGAAREIIRERAAHGAYQSIDGLCRRIDQRVVNRRALDSLVKGGACDCFNLPRQRMCLIADDAAATWDRNGDSALQRSFFDTFDDTDVPTSAVRPQLESVGEWDDSTRLGFEQEALGVYVTGHPLDSYAATWRALVTADARELGFTDQGQDETPVFAEPESEAIEIMGGLLVNCDWRMSRRRKAYGVLTFEDMYGTFEALLWQDMVNQYRQTLKPGQVWMTAGPIRTSYNRRSLSVLRLATAEDALASWPRALRITVTVATEDDALLQQLAEQLRAHPGETPVELALTNTATGHSVVVDTGELRVALSETLLSALEALAGQSSVHCRYTP